MTEREHTLLDAAENVLIRWAMVRLSDGGLGDGGLPEALTALDIDCNAYDAEECGEDAA